MRVIVAAVVLAWAVSVNALTVNTNQLKKKEFGMAGIESLQKIGMMFKEAFGIGTDSPQQEIVDTLKDKGYSDEAIAGIMGNIELETGGTFDYEQKEKGGNAYGLFQFDFMKPYYENYLEENNKDDSIKSQIDFMDGVVKGDIPMLAEKEGAMLKGYLFSGKSSPSEIAQAFNAFFEKGKLKTKYGDRRELADKNYSLFF